MATDLEKLLVQLSADIKGYERAMQRAAGVMNKQAREIENRWRRANTNMDAISRNMARSIVAPLAGVGAALGTRQIASYADAWTRAGNLIAAAGQVAGRSGRSLEGINQIAQDTRGQFDATAELYARLLRSTAGVAESEQQVAQATETVNKAFKAGGAAASEMAAGVLQLSQGLGSGVLAGDELRSVRENAPLLAQAIADYFGTTVAGLKKLGEEGQLTSDKVFKAILSAKGKIDAAFNATAQTIGDAVTKVNNAFTQYIGQSDESLGASGRLTAGLNALADNFDHVADVTLKVAGIIAAALVGRSIAGMIAKLGLATSAVTTFVAALRTASIATAIGGLTAAAGPLGLVIGGTVATALALYYSNTKEATAGSKEYVAALKQVEAAAKAAAPAVDAAGEASAKAANEAFAAAARTATAGLESNVAPALQLFDQIMESLRGADPVGEKQADSVRKLIVEVSKGQAPVAALRAALERLSHVDAFALLARDLQALLPQIDAAATKFKSVGDQLKLNQLQKEFAPFDEVARNEERQRKLREDGEAYLKEAQRRNSLSKEQLRLEEEIARIKKDQGTTGLSDDRIRQQARENIAAADRRSAEGRPVRRDAASRFDQDIQSVRDRTAALVEEQRTIGMSTAARESSRMAMDLEQQALKNLREEARRKGETDLESIQLTQQQKDLIAKVSDEYGKQAAALERLHGPLATFARESADVQKALEELAANSLDRLGDELADVVTGTKSVSDAFKSMSDIIVKELMKIALKKAILGPLASLMGFSDGGPVGLPEVGLGRLYADGGHVRGAGTGTSDSIPARLSNGEFVVNAAATRKFLPLLERINAGRVPGFASGGLVAPTIPRISQPVAGATTVQVKVINQASTAQPEVRQQSGGNIEIVVRDMVRGVFAEDARTNGPMSRTMMARARGFGGR